MEIRLFFRLCFPSLNQQRILQQLVFYLFHLFTYYLFIYLISFLINIVNFNIWIFNDGEINTYIHTKQLDNFLRLGTLYSIMGLPSLFLNSRKITSRVHYNTVFKRDFLTSNVKRIQMGKQFSKTNQFYSKAVILTKN